MADFKKSDPIPADIIMGVIIFVVGSALALLSLSYQHGEIWYIAPSLMPIMVFGSLAFMGLVLALTAKPASNVTQEKAIGARPGKKTEGIPSSIYMLGLLLLYYTVLPRILPFELCTALYLFVAFRMLWKTASLVKAVLVAVAATVLFSVAFSTFFKVMLPGVEWETFFPGFGL